MEIRDPDEGAFTVAKAAVKLNTSPFFIMNYLKEELGMDIDDENAPIREEYIKDLYKLDPKQIENKYGEARITDIRQQTRQASQTVQSSEETPLFFEEKPYDKGELEVRRIRISNIIAKESTKYWWYDDEQGKSGLGAVADSDFGRIDLLSGENFKFDIGDLILDYDAKETQCIKAIAEITKLASDGIDVLMRFKIMKPISINQLDDIQLFKESGLGHRKSARFEDIDRELFKEIIATTELGRLGQTEKKGKDEPGDGTPVPEEPTQDKIPFHYDRVVNEDRLGREPVAIAFVNLIKKDVFTENLNHAFMVHLQGEWGAGKSTFLNLIRKNLNAGTEKWIVVDYNAWQNQHLTPPWWTFIDQIYRQARKAMPWGPRQVLYWKESWRRVVGYNGWKKFGTLLLTLLFLGAILGLGWKYSTDEAWMKLVTGKDEGITLGVFVKLIASIGSVVGLIYSFSKFISTPLYLNSAVEATSFMTRAADPQTRIRNHFNSLVDDINSDKKQRQLAIFIDDIDRCNREFIILLLEGIQTLFKSKKVLYIVAGDQKWISTSFENTYEEFDTEKTNDDGHLGDLFLEKAFQLSLRMPNVSEAAKQNYWSYILGQTGEEQQEIEDVDKAKLDTLKQALDQSEEEISTEKYMTDFAKKHSVSPDIVSNLVIEKKNESSAEIRHLLQELHPLIAANPRAIIRLANGYTMTRSTLIAERTDYAGVNLFRWLVLKDLYPNAAKTLKVVTSLKAFEDQLKLDVELKADQSKCMALLTGDNGKIGEALKLEELKLFEGAN